MGGLLQRVFVPYAAGFVTGGLASVVDAGLANYPVIKGVSKIGLAFAVAFMGRRYPTASTAAIAALAASQGYPLGTKLAGGMIAHNPAQAVKGLGEMAQSYPEMGALLSGGVGALLSGMGAPSNLPSVVSNYQTALDNMAGDDD